MSEAPPRTRACQGTVLEGTGRYGANIYHPLAVPVSEAEGCWVRDPAVYGRLTTTNVKGDPDG